MAELHIGSSNDAEAVKAQYSTSKGLNTRLSLHDKYSVNKQGYGDWVVSHYGIREGMRVLELGCGTGIMWSGRGDLIAKCEKLILSDLSDGMLEAAEKNLKAPSNVEFLHADIQDLPFDDGSFDIVIANSMLYHVPDIGRAIREVRRVLKSDGTFYCATFGENNFVEQLAEWFKLGGESFTPNHNFTLQNGGPMLRAAFSDVEALFYEDSLHVTDVEDLVDYMQSLASFWAVMDLPVDRIRTILNEHAQNGIIDLPKEYGMFIAKGRSSGFLNETMISRSVANEGDTARIRRLFDRARAGEKLVIAFLGGSITQGCLATVPEKSYAYLVYDWFVRTFPNAEFTYVNAGIGGTTSQFGAARLNDDVLAHRPDLCVVEFSVNDSDNTFFRETFESVVSRILESKTRPALMLLHNLFYEDGRSTQKQHLAVGKAYDVPCVSVRDAVYPEIESGNIKVGQLSSDGLHPNDAGHAVLAGLLCSRLEKILSEGSSYPVPEDAPDENVIHRRRITPDAYCTAKRIGNKDTGVYLRGFAPDNTPKENYLDIFKCGWTASKTGDEIETEFTGTELGIQYRKTVNRPAPVAVAIIDDDEAHPVVLDANFDQDWGDSLHIDTLLYHGHRVEPGRMYEEWDALEIGDDTSVEKTCMPPSRHKIKIRIVETHADDRSDFYLVSFITA